MRGPLLLLLGAALGQALGQYNLSCYQCVRRSYEPCPPEALLPCPDDKDRCVTHVLRDEQGLQVRRECGLGFCGFPDGAMSRGLGFDALCDRSRDTFSCLSCCRTSGCNRDAAAPAISDVSPLLVLILAVVPAKIV